MEGITVVWNIVLETNKVEELWLRRKEVTHCQVVSFLDFDAEWPLEDTWIIASIFTLKQPSFRT